MPKAKDIAEKELEKKNDVFADIVNAFLFHGESVVKPEELVDVSPASKLILSDGLHEQERDVSKLWMKDGKMLFCHCTDSKIRQSRTQTLLFDALRMTVHPTRSK